MCVYSSFCCYLTFLIDLKIKEKKKHLRSDTSCVRFSSRLIIIILKRITTLNGQICPEIRSCTRVSREPDMSDGEGSTQSAVAMETGGGGGQLDNMISTTTTTAAAAVDVQQQNVAMTKDDGEPNPKKAKLSVGNDLFGRGGGVGGDKHQTASDKLEHRLGGILCCAVCLDLPRSAIYQVSLYYVLLLT